MRSDEQTQASGHYTVLMLEARLDATEELLQLEPQWAQGQKDLVLWHCEHGA